MTGHKCCSGYCVYFEECDEMGILQWMKVLPIHPDDQPDRDWCKDFDGEKRGQPRSY